MADRKEYSLTTFLEEGQEVFVRSYGTCTVSAVEKHSATVVTSSGESVEVAPHICWACHDGDEGLIYELLRRGIPVSLCVVDGKVAYSVNGFYKSGTANLVPSGEGFVAHTRYGDKCDIHSLTDLALLNLEWWGRSKERFSGWAQPDSMWRPILLELGLIEEKTEVKYVTKVS